MRQKYVFDLTVNGEERRLILIRASGESEEHLAMKLLAYVLFFDRQPKVEFSVGQHFKPDLVCVEDNDITLWIDCGDIALHKLDKISTKNHKAKIVVVKPTRNVAESYKRQADKKLRHPERVAYVCFDNDFVADFVAALSTNSTIVATTNRGQTTLGIAVNQTRLQTTVIQLSSVAGGKGVC
jgi:uncharacterized protein YaeQ